MDRENSRLYSGLLKFWSESVQGFDRLPHMTIAVKKETRDAEKAMNGMTVFPGEIETKDDISSAPISRQ